MRYYLLLIFFSSIVFGQNNYKIRGIVSDEKGSPLPQASLILLPGETNISSDEDGFYIFTEIKAGKYQIRCQYTGYQTTTKKIDLKQDLEINFILQSVVMQIQGITSTAMRADRQNTPVTFSEIHNKTIIESYDIQDVPMMLQFTPGAYAYSETGTGIGYTHFNIRGFHQERMNVMVNGIPLNDPESHSVYWVDMPDILNNTNDIQIQRGVGFSTDGSASFGGSINLRTKAFATSQGASFEAGYGSFNSQKLSAAYETGLLGNYSFSGRFSKIHSDGYRERTAADLYSWYVSGSHIGEKTTWQFNSYGGLEITQLAWNGANPEIIAANRRANDTKYNNEVDNYLQPHFELLFNHEFSSKLNMTSSVFYVYGQGYYEQFKKAGDYWWAEILLPDSIATDKFIRKWLKNHHYGIQANLNYSSSLGKTTAGILLRGYSGDHYGDVVQAKDVDFASLDTPLQFYFNESTKKYASVFANQIWPATENLKVMADLQLRYIDYQRNQKRMTVYPGYTLDKSHFFVNPKIGLLYRLNPKLNLFSSVGISNREPTGNDYFDPKDPGAKPNNDILSERVYDFEMGLRYDIPQIANIDFNIYYMTFANEIIANGQVDDEGNYIHVNADGSYRSGVELSINGTYRNFSYTLNGALSNNRISRYVEYIGNYDSDWNYITTEKLTYENVRAAYSPQLILNNSLGYNFGIFNTILQHNYVSEQYVDNTQSPGARVESYNIFNLLINFKIPFVVGTGSYLSFRINNLLNEDYWQPAYVWWKWKQNGKINYDTRYYVGAPRNYYLSLKLNF